ncbi:hypothetical protein BC830DRAFT_1174336 [Chytriomyces sp. MP71]|nr:hypothetical protein BC830DRAFT_1174336 [Chytriomyces sp. MP71]
MSQRLEDDARELFWLQAIRQYPFRYSRASGRAARAARENTTLQREPVPEESANHFVALLSLTEMVDEMRLHTPGAARLDLPLYMWQNEAPHGKIDEVITLISTSEVVMLTFEIDLSIEDEPCDCNHIELPGSQLELMQCVTASSKNPVILVLISSGSLDISLAKENAKVGAIPYGPYPGIKMGTAFADILMGMYTPENMCNR